MPRVTRAALRSQELQEDPTSVPLPLTPIKGRTPLGEVAGNQSAEPETVDTNGKTTELAKKGPTKGKGNAIKKATRHNKVKHEQTFIEVLEDDDHSQNSSAAEEASKDLMGDMSGIWIMPTQQAKAKCGFEDARSEAVVVVEERPHTPPSAAVDEAIQQLSLMPTAQANQSERGSDGSHTSVADAKQEECHTPTKEIGEEGLGIKIDAKEEEEDSFVEKIKSRTPGKPISRIEDSVEALDALEEEIEKVGGLIPKSTTVASPVKPEKQIKTMRKAVESKFNGSLRMKKTNTAAAKAGPIEPTVRVRSIVSRPSMQPPTAKKASRPSGAATESKNDAASKKPMATPTTAPQESQKAHKRISSIHKAPFQPEKSTKPPTRATFELPGEAVSRRLKEQREERSKREEEEKSKQQVSKPRPVRRSEAPEVKLTATARARLSMAKGETIKPSSSKPDVSKPRVSARPSSVAPAASNKRLSSLSVAKRNPIPQPATSSAGATRAPSLNASSTTRKASMPSAPRAAPTAKDLAHQKVKGKEVFGRPKFEIQERENAKKEKEAAARKARAEASERGRAASRAWAEQQKLRKLEAEKAKTEPKAEEAKA